MHCALRSKIWLNFSAVLSRVNNSSLFFRHCCSPLIEDPSTRKEGEQTKLLLLPSTKDPNSYFCERSLILVAKGKLTQIITSECFHQIWTFFIIHVKIKTVFNVIIMKVYSQRLILTCTLPLFSLRPKIEEREKRPNLNLCSSIMHSYFSIRHIFKWCTSC